MIRCEDLEGVSKDEICQQLSSQDVTAVRRIKVRLNKDLLPTNTFALNFNAPTLSKQVILTYLLNPSFLIPCVSLNANALDKDRIQVEAN